MIQRVQRIHRLHSIPFEWATSALLILDMQAYFLEETSHAFLPSAPSIIDPLSQLAQLFTDHHRPIILTQHVNNLDNSGNMRSWWRDLLTENHPFCAIVKPFVSYSKYLIHKTQYDAFYHTHLDAMLHDMGVHQVVIGGVVTHLCCETTARSAFQRGYDTFFLVNGTATYNSFYHQATLLNLSHGFATLVLCEDLYTQFPSSTKDSRE